MADPLPVTTGNEVEGYAITEYLGVVRGIVVRATGVTRSFLGAFRSFVGGNVRSFELVCEEARAHAYDRLIKHAEDLGADAIIAMRYDATEFAQSVTEVLVYGTAVKLRKK